ncbi:MAG: hypothetical protein FJW61_02215 [Actinobacteria bacterium]|nr:hypothetical protein [Actinomycetota bacterium]MBM3712364.1 hypothetical protein [Actinomycetota bacterium]
MKKCPNCHSLNEEKSIYCGNCGYNFRTQPKSTSFRNFIVIVSVFFSAVIIGLTVYFVLNSELAAGLLSGTLTAKNELQSAKDTDQANTIQSDKSAYFLSGDQQRIAGMFGYPDSFIVMFDEGNNNKRIDCWSYIDLEASFIFEDGAYAEYSDYILEKPIAQKYDLAPQQFYYPMSASEVKYLTGEEGIETTDAITGLKQLVFGSGEIICIFNPDDILIIANKNIVKDI